MPRKQHPIPLPYPFQVFLTPNNLVIVLEFANGGQLLGKIHEARNLTEELARYYF